LNPLILTALGIGLLFCIWLTGQLTNFFRLLKLSGSVFFITRLRPPKRFRLIAYRAVVPTQGHTLLINRICGVGGDLVDLSTGRRRTGNCG